MDFFIALLLLCCFHPHDCLINEYCNVTLGVIVTSNKLHHHSELFTRPAIDIAVQKVHEMVRDKRFVANITMSYMMRETLESCDGYTSMIGPAVAAELALTNLVTAIMGPSCSEETIGVADLAAYWNITLFTPISATVALDDKIRYQTVTRLSYKASEIFSLFENLFRFYGWERGYFLYQQCCLYRLIFDAMEQLDSTSDVHFTLQAIDQNIKPNFSRIDLTNVAKNARSEFLYIIII